MAQTVSIIIASEDRARLAAVIEDRNSAQKHVQRARIVLLSADRLPVLEVARQIGGSRPAVWRWQLRYAEQGVDDLLRTRRVSRAKPLFSWRPWPGCWRCHAPSHPITRRIGPAGRSPRLSASACGRCNASGMGIAFNLTAYAPSRCP